jgi:hypothetical protein
MIKKQQYYTLKNRIAAISAGNALILAAFTLIFDTLTP